MGGEKRPLLPRRPCLLEKKRRACMRNPYDAGGLIRSTGGGGEAPIAAEQPREVSGLGTDRLAPPPPVLFLQEICLPAQGRRSRPPLLLFSHDTRHAFRFIVESRPDYTLKRMWRMSPSCTNIFLSFYPCQTFFPGSMLGADAHEVGVRNDLRLL